jgi:hypothetical protein
MRRRLLLLNLILLSLAAAAGWQLRVQWLSGQTEERRLLRPAAKTTAIIPVAPADIPAPASAASYSNVAQKMLFSRDRSPDVVMETAPVKAVPAFPLAYGVMDLGSGPLVILSEKAGAPNRGYSLGEKVGEFKLAALEDDELVFEFDGRTFRKRLADLKPKSEQPAPQAAASAAAAPSLPAVKVAAIASGPGADMTTGIKACVQGDSTPAGTVRDGYRKVVSQTPFGAACRWELVK